MCWSHWFSHSPPNSSSLQAKDFWSTPLQGKGANQKPGTQEELKIAQLVEPQTKSFSGPSFESLFGQSLFHPSQYMYNPKFYSMIYQSTCMWPFFFVEPTIYWSSGWSYQGVGHQESPDPHLWPEGSFPGCQENQGLISKK